jgi:hypothetical protein
MALVKYNNNSISSVTALDSIASGSLVLLATNNITSGVSSSSFTSNINSTYDTYLFKWINIHPATNNVTWTVNFRDGSTAFDATKTTSSFLVNHTEADGGASIAYSDGLDIQSSTAYASLNENTYGTDADASLCGEMFLFSPSNTTFVKNFLIKNTHMATNPGSRQDYTSGYCNVTDAIDGVDFKFSSGNIDSGIIKMYGLKKS